MSHQTAPLPPAESHRLARLRSLCLLDTTPEPLFDSLTRAAAALCAVPVALISLVDEDRQWFKSNQGLTGVTQTSRDLAFCAHAILSDDLMEVPDAALDERFADNPLVTGSPHIRFYAGMPICLPGGQRIGTLCAIDFTPRVLSNEQRAALADLAQACAQAVLMREQLQALSTAAAASNIIEHSHDAIIALSLDGTILSWNEGARGMFGHERSDIIGRQAALLLPKDVTPDELMLTQRMRDGETVRLSHTVRVHRDGTKVDVEVSVSPITDAQGNVVGMTTISRDISHKLAQQQALALSEARYRAIVEDQTDMISLASAQGLLTYVNAAYSRHFGMTPDAMIGTNLIDYVPPGERHAVLSHLATVCTSGAAIEGENRMMSVGGKWRWVAWTNRAIKDAQGHISAIHSVGRDITLRREAEQALQQARNDLQTTLDTLPSMVGYWDCHLINQFANRAYSDWFNVDAAQVPGMHLSALLGQEIYEASRPQIEGVLAGAPQQFSRLMRSPDDQSERHTLVHYKPDVVDAEVRGFYVLVHDVTELERSRQEAAAATRESAFLLETIHRHAVFSMADRTGQIIEVNEAFCSISGYRRDELVGHTHRVVNSGTHTPAFWKDMWHTIAAGTAWRGEVCNRAKDGSLYWVDSIIVPFKGEDGRIERYASIRFDITASKLAQAQLRESNERFALASDAARTGVWEYNLQDHSLQWDDRMFELYGRHREDGVGAYALWADNLHPDDRESSEQELKRCVSAGKNYEADFRILWPSGEIRHIRAQARLHHDADGEPLRLIGVNWDITERKIAEIKRQETTALLRTVLDSASEVSLIGTEADGITIKLFNRGAERLLGYSAHEMVGVATPALFHDVAEVEARGQELSVALGKPVTGADVFTAPSTLGQPREWVYVRKDGTHITVSLVITAMHDDEGNLLGYLGVAHDVTARKVYEQSLRDASARAEQANQAKSQFLANMSHEIRSPMNAVIGLSYLLGQTPLDEQQAKFLDKIKLSSKSLLGVINDILDISKIEAGELSISREPFRLKDTISYLVDVNRLQAEAKHISLVYAPASTLPAWVNGDGQRLNQILTNLLSNAIKFTAEGSVELVVRHELLANQHLLRFEVHDSGIGIAPDVADRLFQPFAQADASITRRFGGTGLGLSIVRNLATLMGGRVGMHSTPNVGSQFWVEIPFDIGQEPSCEEVVRPGPSEAGPALNGMRLLVVDDGQINLEVAQRILAIEGANVSLASHGQEAVDWLRQHPLDIDAVLMDIHMPVLDGISATRIIRNELGLRTLPIIALTAGALPSQQADALTEGMTAFVGKPFNPKELVDCLLKHVPGVRHQGLDAAVPRAVPPSQNPWPVINGIDARSVALRLAGDQGLFRSLLSQMLTEFMPVREPPAEADALRQWAQTMHKLRGCAGNVGAMDVHALAAEAEAAGRRLDHAASMTLSRQLQSTLAQLQSNAQPWFKTTTATQAAKGAGDSSKLIDQDAFEALKILLLKQNIAALDAFEVVAPALHDLLGAQRLWRLRQCIEDLHFEEAMLELATLELP